MRLRITSAGVFDHDGKEIRPGTVIKIKGAKVPAWLAGKAEVVAESTEGKKAVTNEKKS